MLYVHGYQDHWLKLITVRLLKHALALIQLDSLVILLQHLSTVTTTLRRLSLDKLFSRLHMLMAFPK